MTFEEIKSLLKQEFGESFLKGEVVEALQPQLIISSEYLIRVCDFLIRNSSCYFDSLSCLTAIDNGPTKGTMEILYNLYSIPFHHSLVLKIELDRTIPTVDSVSQLWKTADWHEREAYDFFGIHFNQHPDLRRILLPADWEGFPLRKDYQQQETYHGIKVAY
jgi:NADH-quinone oxidoreductase subunit C